MDTPVPAFAAALRRLAPALGCALLLFLALLALPTPDTLSPVDSGWSVLDLATRTGRQWGAEILSPWGPLAALTHPVFSGGSMWIHQCWQFGGNLLLAASLTLAVLALRGPVRWLATVAAGLFLLVEPALAPWLAMIAGAAVLLRPEPVDRRRVATGAALLGLFVPVHFGHAALAFLTLATFAVARRRTGWRDTALATGAALAATLAVWLLLGQSPAGLLHWLMAGAGQTLHFPSLLVPDASTAAAVPVLVLDTAAVAALAFACRNPGYRPLAVWSAGALLIAWVALARDPLGSPLPCFATIAALAFVWFHHTGRAGALGMWLAVLCAIAGGTLQRPTLVLEPLIALNDRAAKVLPALLQPRALRAGLKDASTATAKTLAPESTVQAVRADAVAVLGDRPTWALFAGLALRPVPTVQSRQAVTPALAAANARFLRAADGPAWVLQQIAPPGDLLPALDNGPAQLALYQNFEFHSEASGGLLWHRRPGAPLPAPIAGQAGFTTQLRRGQALPLPDDATTLWLTIDPGWSGWLRPAAPPHLRLETDTGVVLRYPLSRALGRAGFLVRPFFAGVPDVLRFQAGEPLPRVTSVRLVDAEGADWSGDATVALWSLPALPVAGKPAAAARWREVFAGADRLPLAGHAHIPMTPLPYDGRTVVFAHPDSEIELPLNATDRQFTVVFGFIAGAYAGGNATDGAEFTIEHRPATGPARLLFHRYLDPALRTADRGPQRAEVTIPAGSAGRILLRTGNHPGRNLAWDWCYWTELRFR